MMNENPLSQPTLSLSLVFTHNSAQAQPGATQAAAPNSNARPSSGGLGEGLLGSSGGEGGGGVVDVQAGVPGRNAPTPEVFFFFFITLKRRVE